VRLNILPKLASPATYPQFRAESLGRTFAQSEEADEDILLRVFVRQKRFPAAIGHIVAANKLNLEGANLEWGEKSEKMEKI